MIEKTPEPFPYRVEIYERDNDRLAFELVHNGVPASVPSHNPSRKIQRFVVLATGNGRQITLDWSETPDDPGKAKEQIEQEIRKRILARVDWMDRINSLINQFESWAKDLGWSTRRIEKKLDDPWIGKHKVPALLLQEVTCKVLLEPIGRSSPGTQGIVDLYLLPGYDDIAGLYFYNDGWKMHYMFEGTPSVPTIQDAPPISLSKENLENVLSEMKANAV